MIKKAFCITIICLLSTHSALAKEVKLNWSYDGTILSSFYKKSSSLKFKGISIGGKKPQLLKETTNIKFVSANIVRDKLHFKILFHNTTDMYLCYLVNTAKESIMMDDEFGDEYKGAVLRKKSGQDNKLSPNQRKLITLILDAPDEEVSLVNLHLGLRYFKIQGGSDQCESAETTEFDIHKLDWDISALREE